MEVRAAFLQAKGFDLELYVRPPRETNKRGFFWKLAAASNGLFGSGRLCYLSSNETLTTTHGLKRSKYEHTLHYPHGGNGKLEFILATQVDNYLYTATEKHILDFEQFLKDTFEVTKLCQSHLELMGCVISQHGDGSINISQTKKLEDQDP